MSADHEMAAVLARLATAGDGAVLGLVLAAVAASSLYKYVSSSAALRRICAAPCAPISDLRSLLSPDDTKDEGNCGAPLVVVRGRVQDRSAVDYGPRRGWPSSSKALVPRGSDDKAVAILSTQTCLYNEWRGILGWSYDIHSLFFRSWKEQRSRSFRTVPFILIEDRNWTNSGYVHINLDGSTHPLPLTTVYHELHPIQATPNTFFQAIFGHGYPVALLDEEKILPVGKEITAIGICRPQDEAIEIKACQELPYFLSDMTKEEIVAELDLRTRILFWSGILLGTLSVGILGYAIVRNWWKWKEWREARRRRAEDLRNEAPLDGSMEQEQVPDGQLCVICLTTRRRSAFVPCGHLVCCPRCAMSVELDPSPKCPVCRQRIRSSIRIYDS